MIGSVSLSRRLFATDINGTTCLLEVSVKKLVNASVISSGERISWLSTLIADGKVVICFLSSEQILFHTVVEEICTVTSNVNCCYESSLAFLNVTFAFARSCP